MAGVAGSVRAEEAIRQSEDSREDSIRKIQPAISAIIEYHEEIIE